MHHPTDEQRRLAGAGGAQQVTMNNRTFCPSAPDEYDRQGRVSVMVQERAHHQPSLADSTSGSTMRIPAGPTARRVPPMRQLTPPLSVIESGLFDP
jgi:hypothetical protein